MTDKELPDTHDDDKRRERYEDWLKTALRMADNMAKRVREAAEPERLQVISRRIESANGWRRDYETARAEMAKYAASDEQS